MDIGKMQRDSAYEIMDAQFGIIKKLAGITDSLFALLSLHLSAEELDSLPELEDIKEVTGMCDELPLYDELPNYPGEVLDLGGTRDADQ
ncbi:MAG: hypothetical protein LUE27_05610 [Clostridia bacterium]|nr:hypothetical protein [Clostridia bacterium]